MMDLRYPHPAAPRDDYVGAFDGLDIRNLGLTAEETQDG